MAFRPRRSIGELTYLWLIWEAPSATSAATSARPRRPGLDRMRAT
jgi:hypothetical protein